jgi:imidazolonepropionase-like amidohydrolase
MLHRLVGRGIALLVIALELAAQEHPIAFTGARVLPIAGAPIESGVLVIQQGRIVAIGPVGSTAVPAEAEIRDVSGKVLMPGLVDSHSHIGGWPGFNSDDSSPIQPELRVIDGIDPRDAGIQRAQAGGITTANIMPGSGYLVSGQTLYAKLRDTGRVDGLYIRLADGSIAGGLKMANGTNSLRQATLAKFPGSRAKSAALVREQFIRAREYGEKLRRSGDDLEKRPARDLALEQLLDVLEGRRVVHHHTHRHDDILTVLRLQKEFGFKVVLQHVSDAWKVVDEIAAAGVPCSIILLDSPGGKLEARDLSWTNGARLERAGVLVGFHTDDFVVDSRYFLRVAAFAVRAGMSREAALAGLTLANAKLLDLDERIGSLDVGKDADFIVLSGDPLSVYTRVEQTWVEGEKVFDLENPEDRVRALGGYGAGEPSRPYLCCFTLGGEAEHAH